MKYKLLLSLVMVAICNVLVAQTQIDNKATMSEPTKKKSIDSKSAEPELLAQLTQPADDATSVTVIVQKKQTIEEYRQKGELVLVKVIPNDGVPYFIDPLERDKLQGSGRDLINSGVKPVRWVLKEF